VGGEGEDLIEEEDRSRDEQRKIEGGVK